MPDEPNLLKPEGKPVVETRDTSSVEVVEKSQETKNKEQEGLPQEQEQRTEQEQASVATEISESPSAAPPQVTQTPAQKDQLTQDIERVLAEDLTDVFLQLPPEKRADFKRAGEEAAIKIRVMMDRGKVKAKKILEIIRDWLRIVPGVNKFFLEQEAKIKTDALMDYYAERSNADQNAP